MKVNRWTVGLAAAGLVSLPGIVNAEENMNALQTALSQTTISGYVDTSAHWNLENGTVVPAYAFNVGKNDGFNLNAVKVSIERPLDESQWAAGYKVDLLFGPDANLYGTQSNTGTGAIGVGADFGIKQAYVALRAPVGNGLDFKVGVFDTIIGYEVFEGPSNPNYTRSYGYTIEPFAHTGILMTYQFTDWFHGALGVANTYGPSINQKGHNLTVTDALGASGQATSEASKTWLGSVAFSAPEDWGWMAGSTLYGGAVYGFDSAASDPSGGSTGGAQSVNWYAGLTMTTPIEGLRVGASSDYKGQDDQTIATSSIGSSYANATALYLSWQATEKLSLHGRGEYFSQTAANATTGLPAEVFAFTATAQYDLWKNVISRLEFRWDHQADSGPKAYGRPSSSSTPYPHGSQREAYLIAANIIYVF